MVHSPVVLILYVKSVGVESSSPVPIMGAGLHPKSRIVGQGSTGRMVNF